MSIFIKQQELRVREQRGEARREHLKFSSLPSVLSPVHVLCRLSSLVVLHSPLRKASKLHLLVRRKRLSQVKGHRSPPARSHSWFCMWAVGRGSFSSLLHSGLRPSQCLWTGNVFLIKCYLKKTSEGPHLEADWTCRTASVRCRPTVSPPPAHSL